MTLFDDLNTFLKLFSLVFFSFLGNFYLVCLPYNFISINVKEMELCSYTKSKTYISS